MAGSEYLDSHIEVLDVKPRGSNGNTLPGCEKIRKMIFAKLPVFLRGLDRHRLKEPSIRLLWSSFLVRGCKELEVEKRLNPRYCISPMHPEVYHVSAEVTTDENALVILWLTHPDRVNMHEYVKRVSLSL